MFDFFEVWINFFKERVNMDEVFYGFLEVIVLVGFLVDRKCYFFNEIRFYVKVLYKDLMCFVFDEE